MGARRLGNGLVLDDGWLGNGPFDDAPTDELPCCGSEGRARVVIDVVRSALGDNVEAMDIVLDD